MERCKLLILLVLCISIVGCSADVNVTKCEINVKQGETEIPNASGYFDFGNIPLGFSQSITFTIENTGTETLHLSGSPLVKLISNETDAFKVYTTMTKSTVTAGQSTTFSVNFFPVKSGESTAKISIENDDFDENPYIFTIIGECTGSESEINVKQDTNEILSVTGSFDFGNCAVGTFSQPVIFSIENKGSGDLVLTGNPNMVNVVGTNPEMFVVNQNSIISPIVAGAYTTFSITFNPTSTGVKTAKVSILNNDTDENPYTFTVTGNGVNAPEINIKQGSDDILCDTGEFDFGGIIVNDSSAETFFTIENLGTLLLQLKGTPDKIKISGPDATLFEIKQSSTAKNIQAGTSTSFSITFKPTSTGEKTATISIPNNDDDEDPYIFTIKGAGVVPEINVRQSIKNIASGSGVFDFYRCLIGASSVEITFTIENLGSANVFLTGSSIIDLAGTDSTEFTLDSNQTSSTITPGDETTFKVTFKPTSQGVKTASISIANNDSDENPYTFTIKGEGTNDNAIGWIGGKADGWQTGTAPIGTRDYRSFMQPYGVCTDSEGNIYIADSTNHRVCKWDSAGNGLGWIGHDKDGWQTSDSNYAPGTSYKSFYSPSSVFVDSLGYIYVADTTNHRVCKWSSSGIAIGWIGGGSNGWKTLSAPSSYGTDYQSFREPSSICVDNSGFIFISDTFNHRIYKWDSSGNSIGWIGGGSNGWKTGSVSAPGSDYQSFAAPTSVFVDSIGVIFVTDSSNNRISKWDSIGTAVGWIGGGSNGWKTGNAPSASFDYQSFNAPWGIFVEASGSIYVADYLSHRISKWDRNGNAIGWIGGGSSGWKTNDANSLGSTDLEGFKFPTSVWFTSDDILYIADSTNNRISKWQE